MRASEAPSARRQARNTAPRESGIILTLHATISTPIMYNLMLIPTRGPKEEEGETMRLMPGKKEKASFETTAVAALFTLLLLQVVFLCSPSTSRAQKAEDVEVGKHVIVVKDYKWASAGMGRPAIMKEITLQNKGKSDFQNIDIEVDLYTHNDIPLGSLRTTIKDILPAGTEKTFYNVNFGIMSAELQNSIARVANAELIEKGTPSQAKDLILVKSWEWSGGQYGTEGILKQITLVNKSSESWKDIKIRVDYLGIAGPKVGIRGFTSRAVIHDVLPPPRRKDLPRYQHGIPAPGRQDGRHKRHERKADIRERAENKDRQERREKGRTQEEKENGIRRGGGHFGRRGWHGAFWRGGSFPLREIQEKARRGTGHSPYGPR